MSRHHRPDPDRPQRMVGVCSVLTLCGWRAGPAPAASILAAPIRARRLGGPGHLRGGGRALPDTQQKQTYAAREPHRAPRRREPTAWVGFVLFGGTMLVMLGGIQIIEGLVALFK